ncbi:hypothetical protein [Actinomyces massiliensis]|uniref:hypothetical protein n=1 Tax=Actinomyces massiliensis TaxID=461393 RepID=UPI0002F2BC40|nr:hypothetical protein [Actinomyces massiliensis]
MRRLIEALPRWLYRFQPVFFYMALFGILLGMTGFGGLFAVVFTVVFFVPGQALFWLLSWLAVRRSSDKRLGFSTIPFSVYLLAVPLSYFTAPNTGPQFEETPSAAMRLASVMGLQLTRAVSNDLADVFFMVMLVSGALALLAALADIVRGKIDRAFDKAVAGSRQPAQRGGKNERPEVETAPTSTGAAPPSTGVAPQDPSACG